MCDHSRTPASPLATSRRCVVLRAQNLCLITYCFITLCVACITQIKAAAKPRTSMLTATHSAQMGTSGGSFCLVGAFIRAASCLVSTISLHTRKRVELSLPELWFGQPIIFVFVPFVWLHFFGKYRTALTIRVCRAFFFSPLFAALQCNRFSCRRLVFACTTH